MTVTTDQFEALTPVAYSEARPLLKTGDVLLFHSDGFPEKLIEWGTHSLWCHAAFIWRVPSVERLLLLESVDKYGVRAMPMSTRINGSVAAPKAYPGKLLVLRHPDFPPPPNADKVAFMTAFALDRLGYPYSTQEILQIATRITEGLAGRAPTGRLDPGNGFICSEYVAKCYAELGVDIAPDREGFIAPADIADDPKMQAVCAIKPDPVAV